MILLSNLYKVEVNPKIALERFDTLLGLFCHTAVKLWFTKCKGIEQIQLYFLQIIVWCKKVQHVQLQYIVTSVVCRYTLTGTYVL